MPELPEVETIRQQLSQELPFTILHVDYSLLAHSLVGKKEFEIVPREVVSEIKRTGKLLQFCLKQAKFLFSHMGMFGGWRISKMPITEKHTHVHFKIKTSSGVKYLGYVDPRRFGQLDYLYQKNAENKLSKMGPDLISKEFNADYLFQVFQTHPDKILKPFMLDQKYFAGLGNYMASEICARAGILPSRKCKKINLEDCHKIKKASDSVIDKSLVHQGLTFSGGYSDTTGSKGEGLLNLVVFHQKICGICKKTLVKKIIMQTRGTFYCPKCQC